MPARLAIWLLALCVSFFPVSGKGAVETPPDNNSPPEAQIGAQTKQTSGIILELIAQPRQIEVPGDISVAFRIYNASQGNFMLRDFQFTFIDFLPMFVNHESTCEKGVLAQITVPQDASHMIVCQIKRKKTEDNVVDFFLAMLSSWSLLTISPADYRMVAAVTANQDGKGSLVATRVISLRVVPTVWQAVIGSFVGAFLMVIFWLSAPKIERYITDRSRPRFGTQAFPVSQGFFRKIKQALSLWIGATAAASIAILITFRMKDASLPFTLSVNDFYGGLVMGLFGVILTRWLSRRLFGDNDDEESAGLMGSKSASGQGGAAAQQQTQAAPGLQTNALQPVPPEPPNPEGNPTR
jgi:hypothetical protein